MYRLLLLCWLFCVPVLAFGQAGYCANGGLYIDSTTQEAIRHFYANASRTSLRSLGTGPVGLTFHVVQPAQEQQTFPYYQIAAMVDRANQAFSATGISFYICGSPRYVAGVSEYTFEHAEILNGRYHVPNTINVFLVGGITPPGGGLLCGLAKFPFQAPPERRFLLLAQDCAHSPAPLVHELGHFFGLLHTHETRFGRELVNGSNCQKTGDLICDTPADPRLNLPNATYNCTYVGQQLDYNGDLYQPSVDNYMSYAPYYCQQKFTRGQNQILQETALELHQNLMEQDCPIPLDLVLNGQVTTATVTAFAPVDCRVQVSGTQLEGLSEDIELRIVLYATTDRQDGTVLYQTTISPDEVRQGVELELSLALPGPQKSGTYYLVVELDAQQRIIEQTEDNNYLTTSILIENRSFPSLLLFPNPATEIAYLFLRNPASRGPYLIQIFRPDGGEVLRISGTQMDNEILQPIAVGQLATGSYLAQIRWQNSAARRSLHFFKK